MKLTKQKLIEIIKKELNEVEGLAGGDMNKDEAGINVGEEEAEESRQLIRSKHCLNKLTNQKNTKKCWKPF